MRWINHVWNRRDGGKKTLCRLMDLRFEPHLVESVVFLAVRRATANGDRRLECELHRRIDPLYAIHDPESRNAAFESHYGEFFSQEHLPDPLLALIAEQPLIDDSVSGGVVRCASRRKDESAELFVKRGNRPQRTLLIAVCPDTLLDAHKLARVFRCELLHIADMLDESFGYDPTAEPTEASAAQNNLILDRFRVLWGTYVDGRLARVGRSDDHATGEGLRRFQRVFRSVMNDDAQLELAWHRIRNADRLAHADLMRWSREPKMLSDLASSTCVACPNPAARP